MDSNKPLVLGLIGLAPVSSTSVFLRVHITPLSSLVIRGSGCVFLLLYVDDMIITGNDALGILYSKRFLHRQFEMKDLGPSAIFSEH